MLIDFIKVERKLKKQTKRTDRWLYKSRIESYSEIDVEWFYESWASCHWRWMMIDFTKVIQSRKINQKWQMIDFTKAVQSWVGKYKWTIESIKVKQEFWNENWIDFIKVEQGNFKLKLRGGSRFLGDWCTISVLKNKGSFWATPFPKPGNALLKAENALFFAQVKGKRILESLVNTSLN